MDAKEAKDKAKEALDTGKEKASAFMEEHEVKEKLIAGKNKVNEKIKGLAFRGMVEKKIPAETRAKFPVLDKLIPLTNYIVCILAIVIVVMVISAFAGGGSSGVRGEATATGGRRTAASTILGNYPADYGIAYFNTLGYSRTPTVRDLFGPNVVYLTSFQGQSASVTVESASGTRDEFTATLLLSFVLANASEMSRVFRMQVKFEADAMTERSYVRYVRAINLINGQDTEFQSYGSANQDGEVFGFFVSLMELFWDVSKYK